VWRWLRKQLGLAKRETPPAPPRPLYEPKVIVKYDAAEAFALDEPEDPARNPEEPCGP